jgi:hypothetical protein
MDKLVALACLIGLAQSASACSSTGKGTGPEGGAPPAPVGDASAPLEDASSFADASPAGDSGCAAAATAPVSSVGGPCTPVEEQQSAYGAATEYGVSLDPANPRCGENDVCLVNHFQGRVTCPYGQNAAGDGPDGSPGCFTPGTCMPVRPNSGQAVPAQCANRTAADAVYCSCRCANVDGGTGDGTYCQCPGGMTCTQLVPYIAPSGPSTGAPDMSGAYCIKAGTAYDSGACVACDPTQSPCP